MAVVATTKPAMRGFNTSFFRNAHFDYLLERATWAADETERERLQREAQQLLHDEAPWIFLVSPHTIVAHSAHLHEPFLSASELVTVTEQTWLE